MSSPQRGSVLPEELLWEILSSLPMKVLMRFRCVSKYWNSLVFHPAFVKLHLQRNSTNTSILYTLHHDNKYEHFLHYCSIERFLKNSSSTIDDGSLPFKFNYFIVGVCNGLVCMATTTVEIGIWKFWVRFWNLATRLRSKKSSILSHRISDGVYVKMGFGYDDTRDTYKVVALVGNLKSVVMKARVHCLGDNGSRKVEKWSSFPELKVNGCGQYLNGTLNWTVQVNKSRITSHNQNVIYSLDLKKEIYRYLLLPKDLDLVRHLGVLRGCLCLFQYNDKTHFSMWQMKEFGITESWNMLLNVSCEPYQSSLLNRQFPLCMSENGDVVLLHASDEGFEVIMYKRGDKTVEQIRRENRIEHIQIGTNDFFWIFFDYVQTLVSPY